MSEYILELEGISKTFPGVKALSNVSVKIRPGTVHAFVGENGAGKSTLMNILNGQILPDEGEIYIDGEKAEIQSPNDAARYGISMLHQELNVVPRMTVADNFFLNRELKKNGLVQRRKIKEKTGEILSASGVHVDPGEEIGNLSISEQQIIEIEKILTFDARIIIMDEPTSSISKKESEELLERINRLKAKGITIIYISHRLEELKVIADDITILRDGHMIQTSPAGELSNDKIIELMVGRKMENIYPKHEPNIGETVFEVRNLCGEKFDDISFDVREGEILGVAGLVGAGRTEMAEAIFGLAPISSGEMKLRGKAFVARNPKEAIQQGLVLLPEDRRVSGLVNVRSIKENVSLPNLKRFAKRLLLNSRKEASEVKSYVSQLHVKAKDIDVATGTLSGGNQQKVVIAKWLMSSPEVLIVDEPTRGIDVGAKYEIYSLLCQLADEKKAIVMISSDLPELLGICDRIIVMSSGRLTGNIPIEEASQEVIMTYATQNCDD